MNVKGIGCEDEKYMELTQGRLVEVFNISSIEISGFSTQELVSQLQLAGQDNNKMRAEDTGYEDEKWMEQPPYHV